MFYSGSMTILTLNNCMGALYYRLISIMMAVLTKIPSLILNLNLFPLLFIGLSIPSIHVTPFMDTEVLWNIKCPYEEYHPYQTKKYI